LLSQMCRTKQHSSRWAHGQADLVASCYASLSCQRRQVACHQCEQPFECTFLLVCNTSHKSNLNITPLSSHICRALPSWTCRPPGARRSVQWPALSMLMEAGVVRPSLCHAARTHSSARVRGRAGDCSCTRGAKRFARSCEQSCQV
jgi:hypothetical protein